ncbi:hypothetical protein [Sphingomonas sp.]|uniref:hypothetical protein n=1 Tax=Sphingomonas sp. TaxID=28214 RepID=UPI00286DF684|nr:hypothetical protein [Sphingomonas sp.]
MTRLFLAAGVAALAIAAPASAERGEKGGGHKAHAAKAERGGGKVRVAKAERRGGGKAVAARADRRGGGKAFARAEQRGGGKAFARAERRNDKSFARAENRGGGQRFAMLDRGDKQDRKAARQDRGNRFVVNQRGDDRKVKIKAKDFDRDDRRFARRDRDNDRQRDIVRARFDDDRFDRRGDWDGRRDRRDDWDDRRFADRYRGWNASFCPPGLDKKDNGCLPPGQAKKAYLGRLVPSQYRDRQLPYYLRERYRDNDDYYYRYGDGYLYQVNRRDNLIASLLPLFAGGLGLGQAFPSAYSSYSMPSYYQPFYRDNGDDYYRYANGNVYEIDRDTGMIEDIVPLMAGGYGVGQMLPYSYSAYNVPYQYRDYYEDDSDYAYRYGPGAIYRVDRSSNLVDSVVALLANDLSVGQRLPMGYDAYNVPLDYRDRYYDTADNMYRYNDGNIYQVDPTTQLITAIISAIV